MKRKKNHLLSLGKICMNQIRMGRSLLIKNAWVKEFLHCCSENCINGYFGYFLKMRKCENHTTEIHRSQEPFKNQCWLKAVLCRISKLKYWFCDHCVVYSALPLMGAPWIWSCAHNPHPHARAKVRPLAPYLRCLESFLCAGARTLHTAHIGT